jgi:AraC family transcriptional regulator
VPPSQFNLPELNAQRREELIRECPDEEAGLLLKKLPPGENPDGFEVTIRQLPVRKVAYIRVLDPFQIGAVTGAAERLISGAESRGLADGQWLGYMWGDPKIVAQIDCRYDVGIEADEFEQEGEIGQREFPAMLVADLEIKGSIDLETRAFDWLYGTWLPGSGYPPSIQPCFESWIGRPFAHGHEYFELSVQLPIERS